MIRVTEVLDAYQEPEIVAWKLKTGAKKAEAISKEALAIGTAVDLLIQKDIKGEGYSIEGHPPQVASCMAAWEKFKLKYPDYVKEIEGIQVELTRDGIVGHPDIVHLDEINDIKSGNRLSLRPKYIVQASKYALMAGKKRAAILLLSKESENFLYIYWDGERLDYYGRQVFDAFKLIMDYQAESRELIRSFLEKELENAA